MLVSDWSSDVCSSDLLFFGVVVFGEQLTPRIMLGVLMILTAVTLIIAAKPLLQLVRRRIGRSEERRVGKERRSRWPPYH